MINNKPIDNHMQLVFEMVKSIPKGRVTSYGAIANALGLHARIIGYYLHKSHQYDNIPAHRVVNRNGILSGKMHFANPTAMQSLLAKEGIIVKNDKVVDFNSLFWNPLDNI